MDNRNFTLLTDFYEITMMQGYFKNHASNCVVFDLFYRQNPDDGAYAVCAGLAQVLTMSKAFTLIMRILITYAILACLMKTFWIICKFSFYGGYLCDSGRYGGLPSRTAFESCRANFRSAASGNSNF